MEQVLGIGLVLIIVSSPFWLFRLPEEEKSMDEMLEEIRERREKGLRPFPASDSAYGEWLSHRDPRGS